MAKRLDRKAEHGILAQPQIICTSFSEGKKHDFRLFKESGVRLHPDTQGRTDTGYIGIQKLHGNSELPKKKTKLHPLTKAEKRENRRIASQRVVNEHVIGVLKRFRIIGDCYRNRRKRFGLRFNLIAGIYNFERGFERSLMNILSGFSERPQELSERADYRVTIHNE